MTKFKPWDDKQRLMLSISLQDQIVPGTLEYTLSELVEKRLDLSVFDARYNNDESGATCPLKSHCMSKTGVSRRHLCVQAGDRPSNLIDETMAKMDSEAVKRIYAPRLVITGPVFANIWIHKHMHKFTLRTNR